MYVSGRVNIFDMVDIDLFTLVALNMMVPMLGYTGKSEPIFYNYLKPLTSLDEGLYALACEEDVRCLGTLVRSLKLIDVYIEYGVSALDSYFRAPRFRTTLKEITNEAGSIAANRNEKMLLLTWHESSETTKEPVCEFVTPSSLPQHDSSTPCKDSVCESITPSSGLSHDESFEVDDMDLNLNEPVNLNDTAYETEYDVQYSKDASTDDDDDDDVDKDFLADEENEIVEPDVDVYLFVISMDLPFDNIGITNLVSDDVLEGEDVDVINADGFDSDPGQVLKAVGLDLNNGIYPLAYALVEAESRAKYDLLLNNICEVFNGKIVRGRDKPELTGIPCKHPVAFCWNMALNDRADHPQKLGSIHVIG
uniref:Uncharacterized protein n=1 Tax=Tanacetum cinerariifolium TaxID=118510 RepID=A0A699IDP1_TANCI|nr:hypothetical protein [Tanacetum cinerariifolium]